MVHSYATAPNYAEQEIQRARLLDAYWDCTPSQQQLLQLYSIVYTVAGRSRITACFKRLRIEDRGSTDRQALHQDFEHLESEDLLCHSSELVEDSKPDWRKASRGNNNLAGQSAGTYCNRLLVEIVTREAIAESHFVPMVEAVLLEFPPRTRWPNGPRHYNSEAEFLRAARISLYRGSLGEFTELCDDYERYFQRSGQLTPAGIFELVLNNPFDPDWFTTLDDNFQVLALTELLDEAARQGKPALDASDWLEKLSKDFSPSGPSENQAEATEQNLYHACAILAELTSQRLWQGNIVKAETSLASLERWAAATEPEAPPRRGQPVARFPLFHGWLALLRGEHDGAIAHYEAALKALKKETGKRKVFFDDVDGVFFILLLIKIGSTARLNQALEYLQIVLGEVGYPFYSTYLVLTSFIQFQQGDLSQRNSILSSFDQRQSMRDRQGGHCIEPLIHALAIYWLDPEHDVLVEELAQMYRQFTTGSYGWLALETAEILARLQPESSYPLQAEILREDCSAQLLIDLVKVKAPWEIQLGALTQLYQPSDIAETVSTSRSHRLVWWLTVYEMGYVLQPREQKVNAKGSWSKGRAIALKRLAKNRDEFDYLTPQDKRICDTIEVDYYGYSSSPYDFGDEALVELIGHPNVYWEATPTVKVEVLDGEPEVRVLRQGEEHLTIEFFPPIEDAGDIVLYKESPTRLRVYQINDEHRRIAEILGNAVRVPAAAEEQVLGAIRGMAKKINIQSDIGGGDETAEVVPTCSRPHVHLLPAGEGLKASMLCRPFGEDGPYYHPGQGGETVITEIEGRRVRTQRSLQEELTQAEAVINACPPLAQEPSHDNEWVINEPEQCLELLSELKEMGDQITVEWPQGEKLRVTRQADLDSLQMRLQSQGDWFEASGEIQLENDQVIDMQRVIALLSQSQGRFVQLDDGQFLALSETFRQRLEELSAFSEMSKKGLRVNPLASSAIEDWIDDIGDLQADQAWHENLSRIRELDEIQPKVPSTLQAELRDYQIDGFHWLARLAHWGVGACLADDMGLGKTLQSLTLILTRAPEGPTLVVAPTSVGFNWMAEARKFTPTLNPISLGIGDRTKTIQSLKPFDLLICTYGLLQQPSVSEQLAEVEWQTIVLDEAQAIKNANTKRSKAAMQLQGGFKILTTGTPIENHLGELWNLFRFINPGLLSSLDKFNQRFAAPIERYQDKDAKRRLKKLIQPFILRRTKTQVLKELPSRTEIVLNVELSKAEMTLYEAMRRDALERLSEKDGPPGQQSLQVLAEIMKLRRLCCNPRLVMPDTSFGSAKLDAFREVLAELLDNNHKALVFSQFVDHLAILRDHLDEQGITYQYLDGSTPTKQRQKRVDAFQAGEGDVFLISLKAGGTGLNLTAADYVIHMDPWWNPAVEDQASDRAHRMGQKRPVTIYRLVTQGTIEEKIVELHQQKRDLADSLLEGTESSSKLSTDDLLKLIQER